MANVDFGPEAIGGGVAELVPVYDARLELVVVLMLVQAIEDLNPKVFFKYFLFQVLYNYHLMLMWLWRKYRRRSLSTRRRCHALRRWRW